MEDAYKYLCDLAMILLGTKLLGMLTRKIQLPSVVGALLAGLILGPCCLGWIVEDNFIKNIAEVGVIVLMFSAGLETDISELKKSGLASFVIAVLGVVVPLFGGYITAKAFGVGNTLQNMFIGVILTATSVSITVETLKELGKLSTRSGNAILGAALIDDVLGIIALTIITSFTDESVSIPVISLKILGFFVFSAVMFVVFNKLLRPLINGYRKDLRRFSLLSFAFCLVMSYVAEDVFGVSDITGAFIAGLILSSNKKTSYILSKFEVISYMLLSPVFFASVGLKVSIGVMSSTIIAFSFVLLIVAIVTKLIGCGFGAKICGYTNIQAVKIGLGMISRGEVALIIATKGAALGLMNNDYFAPIVIVVVVTTIVTPIFLKLVYKYQAAHDVEKPIESSLVERMQERESIEMLTQQALNMHDEYCNITEADKQKSIDEKEITRKSKRK